MFRTLKANEIDVRIGTCKKTGLSLLLYKDARADMIILDEKIGAMNWKREHTRDNANCIVSIWDKDKSQWISKEDTGTESFTEKEKGLASDSFKRACVNWGIGRELYTTPFIWISSDKCKIEDSGRKDKNGKPVYICKDNFVVKSIESGLDFITDLVITNDKGKEVFNLKGKGQDYELKQEPKQSHKALSSKLLITEQQKEHLSFLGTDFKKLEKYYGKAIDKLTFEEAEQAIATKEKQMEAK